MRQLEIEQGEVTLVMNAQGPRKGPTLLFLHAGGESRRVWSPIFSRLRPQHWQLVAPDLRGHGESGRSEQYCFEDLVADAYQIIQRLKGRPLVLVGSSLGGLLALALAKRYPLLIDGLVLLDAPSRVSVFAANRESRKIIDEMTETKAPPAEADAHCAAAQVVDDLLSKPQQISEAARSVSVPTLFLHGRQSTLVGEDEVAALRADIPHVETAAVDAGHLIAQDNPRIVAEQIAAFVPTLIPETIH